MKISKQKHFIQLTTIGLIALLTACSQTTTNQSETKPNKNQSLVVAVTNKQNNSGMGMHHNMSMDLGTADEEYDLRFIDSMIPHHQGAIEMAKEVLTKTKRPEMKQLAEAIITAQNKEIEQMQQWRKSWYAKASDTPIMWHSQMNHSMPMTQEHMSNMMMNMDLGDADDEFDLRFINAMIPHHEGALTMAKDALSKTKRSEIKELAKDILTSQQKEIDEMTQWRENWYEK
jgi:uncharacterized protein (DUF305 family)